MKEKALMAAFVAGNTFDTAISFHAYRYGAAEFGFLPRFGIDSEAELLAAKLFVVASLTLGYAISKKLEMKRTGFTTEAAMALGSIAVWGTQVWNVLNVVLDSQMR